MTSSLLSIYQLEPSRSLREFAAKTSSPDPEGWRGRKRHRSLTRGGHGAFNCGGTSESSNLRGRARRRSTSPVGTRSRTSSRVHGSSEVAAASSSSLSPARKRLLRMLVPDRRRSQSPSRSRSPNAPQKPTPLRRRQRTQSHSRSHASTSLPAAACRPVDAHQPAAEAAVRHGVLLSRQVANQPADPPKAEY